MYLEGFVEVLKLIANCFLTCENLAARGGIKQGISHPVFHENSVYKTHKFKKYPPDLTNHLNMLIHNGYQLDIVVRSFSLVFVGRNIDTLNYIITRSFLFFIAFYTLHNLCYTNIVYDVAVLNLFGSFVNDNFCVGQLKDFVILICVLSLYSVIHSIYCWYK